MFEKRNLLGNSVQLLRRTWVKHICLVHPEVTGLDFAIRSVVEVPSEVRFAGDPLSLSEPGYCGFAEGTRVLVIYSAPGPERGTSVGRVATAYPVNATLFPGPRLGELIYHKSR